MYVQILFNKDGLCLEDGLEACLDQSALFYIGYYIYYGIARPLTGLLNKTPNIIIVQEISIRRAKRPHVGEWDNDLKNLS